MKILRHFPIIFKLQKMFRMHAMSFLLLWYVQNISPYGLVKHPCDSKASKHINERFLVFALNARNVHLGFAINNVNPYKLNRCNVAKIFLHG
jgi:hypothetical protein